MDTDKLFELRARKEQLSSQISAMQLSLQAVEKSIADMERECTHKWDMTM